MRVKEHSNLILALIVCIISTLILMFFIIPWESGIETIEFGDYDQHLSWSHYYGGNNNQYFTLDRYSFSLNDVLLKNSNWPWKWHIGIELSIEINASDVNGTHIDHLEKMTLWEGIAFWNGFWDYESPNISLDSLQSIHSTGFRVQIFLIFKYRLIESIFFYSIHELKILASEIEYP